MKINSIQQIFFALLLLVAVTACNNDDEGMEPEEPMAMATCDDGMMNGDETGIDCGGSCEACEVMSMDPDFSGTYAQVDFMGRPGINTVLSANDDIKNMHNQAIPDQMGAMFQPGFESLLEAYHDAYAVALGLTAEQVDYENNILGLDAATLTTVLASDVLEVAPDAPTTYFNPGEDNDGDDNPLTLDGDEVALTGRTPQDDVIDVSLILLFGGMDGIRFSGQDVDDDGMQDLPILNTDGVSLTATISDTFPYLGDPE